jgi:TonB family protein
MVFPQPMSRTELRPNESHSDPTDILEQHLLAGFPPDLALDLVLNELVVKAAEATHASAAALALLRGDEMVCRAATGHLAPDLGVPLNIRDGLSGACLQTRQPQLSVDTEFDPRVDPVISRRLGIRSILIVPVFEGQDQNGGNKNAAFTGILEVFSGSPAAFSHNDQKVLESFAEECARIRQAAMEMSQRKPVAATSAEVIGPELAPAAFAAPSPPPERPAYEVWALVLGALTILATIAVSFLIGSRIGWLSHATSPLQPFQPANSMTDGQESAAAKTSAMKSTGTKSTHGPSAKSTIPAPTISDPTISAPTISAPTADELVVYEKGKVIFRMKPAKPDAVKHNQAKLRDTKPDSKSIVEASSTVKISASKAVWLSPTQAETRLLSRTEPEYPPEALAAHRSGNVVLEVQVGENGAVSNVRTLNGDPLLAAAATEAVRKWRYQPYRLHDRPRQFQTDVTLSFSLPN